MHRTLSRRLQPLSRRLPLFGGSRPLWRIAGLLGLALTRFERAEQVTALRVGLDCSDLSSSDLSSALRFDERGAEILNRHGLG